MPALTTREQGLSLGSASVYAPTRIARAITPGRSAVAGLDYGWQRVTGQAA
jgi:hypothetical protein